MSDPLVITANPPVKPLLPSPVAVSPTSAPPVSVAPTSPTGGAAFSASDQGIQAILDAKNAEINASIGAMKANNQIDTSTTTALSGVNTDILGAIHNVERAQSLPGGGDGKLAKIIGLFDDDYNVDLQKTRLQEYQLRAGQISSTADAIKAQNNALPLIYGKITEAASAVFNAQTAANHLAIEQGTLATQQIQAKIAAAHLSLDMNADARAQIEFNVRRLTPDQAAAALAQARTGKGPWVGKEGFLQDRIVSETAAETSLANAQLALQQGRRDDYNNSMSDFIGHLPADLVRSRLEDTQKNGGVMVDFQTGVDPKTKKPIIASVPIPLVEAGLIKSITTETAVNTAVAADISSRTNLVPKIQNLMTGASAFASIDPRATSIVTQAGSIVGALDAKNPNNVRQIATLIDTKTTEFAGVVKDFAEQFHDPEAKAAITHFGNTGTFDPPGATAVITNSLGSPFLSHSTLYRSGFGTLNTLLATAIQKSHIVDSGGFDPSKNGDAQAMINAIMQRTDGKETIRALSAEILANPVNQKIIAGQIAGVIRPKAVNSVLEDLANQHNANPIWKDIYSHPEQFMSPDNNGKPIVNYQKLFETFEKHSITTGNKVNYAAAFLSAMRSYATTVDTTPSTDPRYTWADHALESSVYGSRPHQAVLGDFIGALAAQAARSHADMMKRVQQDLTGGTQREAIQLLNGPEAVSELGPLDNITSPSVTSDKNLQFKLSTVPSATGTGLTADAIKRIFGGGQ